MLVQHLRSKHDADALDLEDGEEVLVESVRGKVELPVRIGGVEKGQTFIPFHFGYFDSTDGKARAANELTTGMYVLICTRSDMC
jgi:ferredoxin-nitrate reductase